MAVVLTIFASAVVAGVFAVERIVHPLTPAHLFALATAGVVGIIGNAVAARIRSAAGQRLNSPALIADGAHARSDAIVSAGVVLSAGVVALGLPIADPIIGLVITAMILRITWESWHAVRGHANARLDGTGPPLRLRQAPVAQRTERRTSNPRVGGSNPPGGVGKPGRQKDPANRASLLPCSAAGYARLRTRSTTSSASD